MQNVWEGPVSAMLNGMENAAVVSTRDRLVEEAYQELSGYYRAKAQSSGTRWGHEKSDGYLAELEKECSHKVLD